MAPQCHTWRARKVAMSRQNRRAQGRQEGGGGKKCLEQAQLDMSCGIRVHDWSGERFTTKKHSETTLGKQTSSTHWLIFFAARALCGYVLLFAFHIPENSQLQLMSTTHATLPMWSSQFSELVTICGWFIYPSNKLVIWGMVQTQGFTTLRLHYGYWNITKVNVYHSRCENWRFGQAAGDVADRAWMSDSSMLDAVWHGQNMPKKAPKRAPSNVCTKPRRTIKSTNLQRWFQVSGTKISHQYWSP